MTADPGRRVTAVTGLAVTLIGQSEPMNRVREFVRQAARASDPVLIRGETGVGKELIAGALHAWGPRDRQPFVAVNCASLPASLAESELFGHTRGAFTGAAYARAGCFETAGAGTIFLDEIGDASAEIQGKLLRVLEDRTFRRLGGDELPLRARVVAATNRDLESAVAAGSFRADLYFRLSVLAVRAPALRERPEDIEPLAAAFIADGRPVQFSSEALSSLVHEPWPGNVRQLRALVRRAAVLSRSEIIGAEECAALLAANGGRDGACIGRASQRELTEALVEGELGGSKLDLWRDLVIAGALARTQNNQAAAARLLGVDRNVVKRWWRRNRTGR